MASFRSAESIESIKARSSASPKAAESRTKLCAGEGDALAGDCADKFSRAAPTEERRVISRERRGDISGLRRYAQSAQSNIPAIMTTLEMDLRNGLVGASRAPPRFRREPSRRERVRHWSRSRHFPAACPHGKYARPPRQQSPGLKSVCRSHIFPDIRRKPSPPSPPAAHPIRLPRRSDVPSIVASRSGNKSDFNRGRIACVSGSPKRQLNSGRAGHPP